MAGCAEPSSTDLGVAEPAQAPTGYWEASTTATAEVTEEAEKPHTLETVAYLDGGYDILQDSKTGCMYVQYSGGYQYGITPYYDGRGKVAGCFASEEMHGETENVVEGES